MVEFWHPFRVMADDLYFSMDVERYNHALSVYMSRGKRRARVVLEQQAKLITKRAINITPPSKTEGKGADMKAVGSKDAREKGEKSVEASLNKLFKPVKITGTGRKLRAEIDANTANMAALHQAGRNKRGRVGRSLGESRYKVAAREFKQYVIATKARVGQLAHGWASAAEKLGIKLPGWISRHSGKASGAIQIIATDTDIKVILSNDVRYASDMAGIQGRLNRAVKMQRSALIKQINDLLKDDSPFRSL